jgi:hypothetical protein
VLSSRGLRRRVLEAAPHVQAIPFAVASSEALSTLPARVGRQLVAPLGLQVLPLALDLGGFRVQAL